MGKAKKIIRNPNTIPVVYEMLVNGTAAPGGLPANELVNCGIV
jgi:hypothetical protein